MYKYLFYTFQQATSVNQHLDHIVYICSYYRPKLTTEWFVYIGILYNAFSIVLLIEIT